MGLPLHAPEVTEIAQNAQLSPSADGDEQVDLIYRRIGETRERVF
jgi:hypothetical protein